jgi:hypothetical protein
MLTVMNSRSGLSHSNSVHALTRLAKLPHDIEKDRYHQEAFYKLRSRQRKVPFRLGYISAPASWRASAR